MPKFGNWENEDNVPYTVYFEKARKNKGGKMINPNHPVENPATFDDAPPRDEPDGRGAAGSRPERRVSKEEDADSRNSSENPGPRAVSESTGLPALPEPVQDPSRASTAHLFTRRKSREDETTVHQLGKGKAMIIVAKAPLGDPS